MELDPGVVALPADVVSRGGTMTAEALDRELRHLDSMSDGLVSNPVRDHLSAQGARISALEAELALARKGFDPGSPAEGVIRLQEGQIRALEAEKQRWAAGSEALQGRLNELTQHCSDLEKSLENARKEAGFFERYLYLARDQRDVAQAMLAEREKMLAGERERLEIANRGVQQAVQERDEALRHAADREAAFDAEHADRDAWREKWEGASQNEAKALERCAELETSLANARKELDEALATAERTCGALGEERTNRKRAERERDAAVADNAALLERVKRLEGEVAEVLGLLRTWAGEDKPTDRSEAIQELLRKAVLSCPVCGDDKPVKVCKACSRILRAVDPPRH